ncbi:tetratricopeptide repeat protein [Candidatus Uabimicrobium sp. HlEnr_7]|uniref:protein kinase domain-containing protein n=1 Tax=Candidatus Uabimicrobium helgolandensis TaxID=3095367 RepID=UPI0035582786
MNTNISNIEELQDALNTFSNGGNGSLEMKNPYVIKQFNYESGYFTSWFTSNRNRQMGNVGFALLQQGFVPCEDLYNAFLQQVKLRKHYCEILVDSKKLSAEHLQIAINQALFEEVAEVFIWQEGKYKVSERKIEQSSMYGNPYLQTFQFRTSIEKITSQINGYLKRWQFICEQLQNLNIILYMNQNLKNELREYLHENYILYSGNFDKDANKIFLNCIGERVEKNLSFFNKQMTLHEIIPLLSIDPLWFCNLVLDLEKHSYLVKMSPEQIMDLAESSKKENNTSETRRLYNVLLESKEVEDEDKKNIQNVITSMEETASRRIKTHSSETISRTYNKEEPVDEQFPGYEIMEELGRGAMGTVYKARQKSLQRDVAIKVVRPSLAIDEVYIKRLELEAKTMAKLRHPSIVSAIDFGFQKNLCYIVMEYVDGGTTLLDIIGKNKVNEKEILRIGLSIAGALKYLHENHLIHRDIKPSNILLDKNQTAKLADLGLIKDTQASSDITFPGSAVGTPSYMSPEQLQMDNDIDIRSDIYSLGATLFYAMTGTSRFDSSVPPGVIYHKIISLGNGYVKKEKCLSTVMKQILGKMLEPKKENRYQTPEELIQDFELVIIGKGARYAKKRRLPLQLLLFTLFLCAAITVFIRFPEYVNSISPSAKASKKEEQHKVPEQTEKQNNDKKNVQTTKNIEYSEDLEKQPAEKKIEVVKQPTQEQIREENKNLDSHNTNETHLENLKIAFNNEEYATVISQINKLKNPSPEFVNIKGHSYIALEKYKDALACFKKLSAQKHLTKSYLGAAKCYYLSGEIKKSYSYLKRIKGNKSIDFYYLRARVFYKRNMEDKARKDLNYILKKSPDFWKANYLLSIIWLKQQPTLALESLNIAFENGADQENSKTLAWLYYYKGILLYKEKNFKDARQSFDTSLSKINTKEALFYCGLISSQNKKNDKAIDYYTNALVTDTLEKYKIQNIDVQPIRESLVKTKIIHFQRGQMFLKRNNYKLALSEFQHAIKLDTKYLPGLKAALTLQQKQQNLTQAVATLDVLIELQPENNSYYWERANLNFKLKKHTKVISDASLLVKRSFQKEQVIRLRAKSYTSRKDKRALKDINYLLQINPQDLKLLINQARLYERFKDNRAKLSYEKILLLDKSNEKAYKYLLRLYLKAKNYANLAELYEKRLKISPNNLEYLYGAARCYVQLQKYNESIPKLQKIKEQQTGYLESLYYLGYSYYFEQRHEQALVTLSMAIKRRTKNRKAYYLRGNIYHSKGMYREAVVDLSTYIKYDSQNVTALYLRAQSYQKLELYSRAFKDYKNLAVLSPENYKARENKGICEVKLKQYKSAIRSFLQAKNHIALETDSYHYLGYCYSQLGKLQKAMDYYKQAIRMDSSHSLARTNYAITLYALKKYKEALSEISKAIDSDRSNANALENRGKIYLKLKKYKNAVNDFATVIQIDTNNKDAFYYLGLSYYKLQNLPKAKTHFQKALFGTKKKVLAKKYLQVISQIEKEQ